MPRCRIEGCGGSSFPLCETADIQAFIDLWKSWYYIDTRVFADTVAAFSSLEEDYEALKASQEAVDKAAAFSDAANQAAHASLGTSRFEAAWKEAYGMLVSFNQKCKEFSAKTYVFKVKADKLAAAQKILEEDDEAIEAAALAMIRREQAAKKASAQKVIADIEGARAGAGGP
jgi:hypothetical protein